MSITETIDPHEGPYGRQRRLELQAERERKQAADDKEAEWAAEQAKRQAVVAAQETAERQLEDRRNAAALDATQAVVHDSIVAAIGVTTKARAAWDTAAADPSVGVDRLFVLHVELRQAMEVAAVTSEFGQAEQARSRAQGPDPQSFASALETVTAIRVAAVSRPHYEALVIKVNSEAAKAIAKAK